ncbi:LysR substrate-binding domain-containing protein [Pseudohalocynthiibacter aestuariivivens]|jgi:DNA-binding transcriptional LysR family regulator|uniref:LysR substrate-binding domain-containing protein n=1 Tax=Pseudohalocynthiibacter aestuariivivens TaxID=1591409 RepID=A0ABV5JLL2_9RHOB|nr:MULTISPECIES: LysR substrate-binding domain-containing protein [Pseudohalocynthiibacter]MBS9718270.1 LysR family transcriptional regulator [Pseudohalocynthiibacter aestuariivivens]MCK0103493.1 LysR family transcriptional regulator [Pseudohalocynthiibacter sp. F2068]
MDHLNSDLLRTFLAIADTGSFTEGAARIYRSQSAASLQIKRLEEIVRQPVFERHGRGVVLTPAGEQLVPVARDVTGILESTLRELTSDDLHGKLRLGIPDDQSRDTISRIVGEFAQLHPSVELNVTCAISSGFPKAIENGALDLAVYEVEHLHEGVELLAEETTHWMVSRYHDLLSRDVIPVALFDRDCWWRDAALNSLNELGRPFRIVFSSQSVTGVAASIEAGIAIGLLAKSSQSASLRLLAPNEGFSEMPASKLVLANCKTANGPAFTAMKTAIRNAFNTM